MPTLGDVSRIAASLPGTLEKPSGGGLAWFVRRNPYAWEQMPWPSEAEEVRALVSSESCIGVRLAHEDDKRALLQSWPRTFAVSGTPWLGTKIIVRLAAVDLDHLSELLTESWRTQAPRCLRDEFDARSDR